jgi:hypothetical protein
MTTEIFHCGILHGSGPQPPDDHGCILPDNHEGPHEYIARDGVAWQWETNLECDCEWCRRGEGDYCTVYWRKADSAGEREYQSWVAMLAAGTQEPDALAGFDGLAPELADRGATSCTNCHPNVAPEYRCTACPWKNAKPEIYLWAEDKDLLEALRASGVQPKGGCVMHETESPAPANVVLTREDAHFLAVRLRRLCAHLHYALPKFADDDANLVNIAGTVIGALLTNLTHGVATTPAPGNAEWEKDSLASCREHSGDDLCATCGKIWNDHFGRCCDPNPSARRFTLASGVPAVLLFIDAHAIDRLRDPDALSVQATIFRHGGRVNGREAIAFTEVRPAGAAASPGGER